MASQALRCVDADPPATWVSQLEKQGFRNELLNGKAYVPQTLENVHRATEAGSER